MLAIVGGIEGVASEDVVVDEYSSGNAGVWVEVERVLMGVVFVGLAFTKVVMSSGVFAGVTLSMNCHEGRSSTMVLSSEWLGIGMSDAESISFWIS